MSSGGLQQPGGSGVGHVTPDLRKQLDDTVVETDRFLDTLSDKLAQHDREHTLFTPASEYLKGSVEHVRSALDEFKRDAGRTDAEQASHEDREALAMSLDNLSCAVESLTHFARAFDEHKRSLPHAATHETASSQHPHGAITQDSVEKLVRSVLTHVHLGFNTLQRSLGQVEHHGNPLQREAPPSKDKEAQAKPSRARRNSINVESLEDEGDIGSFGHEGLKVGRGYSGRMQFADQVGPAP